MLHCPDGRSIHRQYPSTGRAQYLEGNFPLHKVNCHRTFIVYTLLSPPIFFLPSFLSFRIISLWTQKVTVSLELTTLSIFWDSFFEQWKILYCGFYGYWSLLSNNFYIHTYITWSNPTQLPNILVVLKFFSINKVVKYLQVSITGSNIFVHYFLLT